MNSILIISASTKLQLILNLRILGMGVNWYRAGLFIDLHIRNSQHGLKLGFLYNMVERMMLQKSKDVGLNFVPTLSLAVR